MTFQELGLVADPVIEAIARLEFEHGLRTGVLYRGCWCPWGGCTYPRINPKPPWGAGWSWVECGCHKVPISDQIPILPSSVHGWY